MFGRFVREHRHLMPMLLMAVIASGYMACGDETIDPTPAPEDGGGVDAPKRDDAAALDGTAADGNATDGNATDGNAADSTADSPEDAPIDGPDDSPTSNG